MNPFVHDPSWGWWIIMYFFFGGLAAGCYFLAALIELFGHQEDRYLARIGYRVAFPLVCLCGVLLIVDLDRPERFWHMVLQSEVVHQALDEGWPQTGWDRMGEAFMLKVWSPMSIGAQALGIFGLCSALSLLGTVWPFTKLAALPGSRLVGWAFKLVGCAVGFFIAAYTGALLTATNQPLWSSSEWIGPIFLTSAASTSISLLLLLDSSAPAATRHRLERADLWALGLELFIFLMFLASLGGILPLVLTTVDGLILVLGTLVVGLLLPLVLHMGVRHRPSALEANNGRIAAAAACALIGGFLLRFGIVRVAPALLHRYPYVSDGYPYVPDAFDEPLWQSMTGKALVAGTLLLAVLIPVILTRQWRLSAFQSALAGLASLLAIAGVIAYSIIPSSALHLHDPFPEFRISPEDGRERGGGPGASASNRPEQPLQRGNVHK
jgi:formate-dependent nitrite reductase membrane component NrfD